jgi:hypothetical protein
MQDNPNTDSESPPLDCEDWQIAFKPYVKYPFLALALAQHLTAQQDFVQSDTGKAIAAINRAVNALYEHSEFRSVGLLLFRATVQGRLPVEQENLIHQLGIANDYSRCCFHHFGWRILALAFNVKLAVNLDQHRIANTSAKRVRNCVRVSSRL